jgi:hypothetical protein
MRISRKMYVVKPPLLKRLLHLDKDEIDEHGDDAKAAESKGKHGRGGHFGPHRQGITDEGHQGKEGEQEEEDELGAFDDGKEKDDNENPEYKGIFKNGCYAQLLDEPDNLFRFKRGEDFLGPAEEFLFFHEPSSGASIMFSLAENDRELKHDNGKQALQPRVQMP